MNIELLKSISGLLAEARGKLNELDIDDSTEDMITNWTYDIESVETEIDDKIEELEP